MSRAQYPHFQRVPTRWMDNDVYGHVNNVVYYSYFDTVINTWLIQHAGLDIHTGRHIGLCAESHCRFLGPLAFPDVIEAGLRVEKLGRSSVRYGIGLFTEGAAAPAAEDGSCMFSSIGKRVRRRRSGMPCGWRWKVWK